MVTKQELIDFSNEIDNIYKKGLINSPVHLHGGNEDELRYIFKEVDKNDWICSTHRSHYHWLLSGRSKESLKKLILRGRSMHLFDDKFITSSIVGGIAPIAVGIALGNKLLGKNEMVWCFMGDMAYSTGLAQECLRYSLCNYLPIKFINEDNGMSVNVTTESAWGGKYVRYKYERIYPHAEGLSITPRKDSEYHKNISKLMEYVLNKDNSLFIGQNAIQGKACGTLNNIDEKKLIEMPVAEEMQLGICIGLSLVGFYPICYYPRIDFIPRAWDQVINHLCLFDRLSEARYKPKMMIRTGVGLSNSGLQHNKDLTDMLIFTGLPCLVAEKDEDFMLDAKFCIDFLDKPFFFIERHDLYAA